MASVRVEMEWLEFFWGDCLDHSANKIKLWFFLATIRISVVTRHKNFRYYCFMAPITDTYYRVVDSCLWPFGYLRACSFETCRSGMVPFTGLARDRLIPYFIRLEIFVVFLEGRLGPPDQHSHIPPFSKDININKIITKSEKGYKPSCRPANGESVRLTGLEHPYKQALNNSKTFLKKTLSNKSPKSRGSKALPVVDTSWQFPKYFLSSQLNGLSRQYLLSEAQREEFQ